MGFQAVEKQYNVSKINSPGIVYINAEIRRLANMAIGGKVELLVDPEKEEILLRKKTK